MTETPDSRFIRTPLMYPRGGICDDIARVGIPDECIAAADCTVKNHSIRQNIGQDPTMDLSK
jgi:hypothetical protein